MRGRFLVLLLAAGCPANGSQGRDPAPDPVAKAAPVQVAPPAPPEAGAVALTEDMARSNFADGPAAKPAARFALEDWREARKGFAALLKAEKDPAARSRYQLMVALCDANLGNHAAAATGFEKALAGL